MRHPKNNMTMKQTNTNQTNGQGCEQRKRLGAFHIERRTPEADFNPKNNMTMKRKKTESGAQNVPEFVQKVAEAARGYYASDDDFKTLRNLLEAVAFQWDVETLRPCELSELTLAVFDAKDQHPKAVDALAKVIDLNGAVDRRMPAMMMLEAVL